MDKDIEKNGVCKRLKIIVFGLGKDFYDNKEEIYNFFDVVACTDNYANGISSEINFIEPSKILDYEYDLILICSRRYFEVIRLQLVKDLKIPYEKIMNISDWISIMNGKKGFQDALRDLSIYEAKKCELFPLDYDSVKIMENDRYDNAGNPSEHYFAQDIWGAKKVVANNPTEHYDIGSRLDGFLGHLLVFRDVNYIDIRPLPYEIDNLHFVQGDATNLENIQDETIESLSSFHALEHFGLGRYGDKLDVGAYMYAAKNMMRVLTKGGRMYLGVPVGSKDKLCFNAHRIFSIRTILELFDELELVDLAIVYPGAANAMPLDRGEIECIPEYSCGLFEFIKPK